MNAFSNLQIIFYLFSGIYLSSFAPNRTVLDHKHPIQQDTCPMYDLFAGLVVQSPEQSYDVYQGNPLYKNQLDSTITFIQLVCQDRVERIVLYFNRRKLVFWNRELIDVGRIETIPPVYTPYIKNFNPNESAPYWIQSHMLRASSNHPLKIQIYDSKGTFQKKIVLAHTDSLDLAQQVWQFADTVGFIYMKIKPAD